MLDRSIIIVKTCIHPYKIDISYNDLLQYKVSTTCCGPLAISILLVLKDKGL
ncbi:uncharacterized protein DS421_6g176540 [Arachis hypogaea]|nr:uncharacterized protein DS421_6g176540 [Arachis hypogaea]